MKKFILINLVCFLIIIIMFEMFYGKKMLLNTDKQQQQQEITLQIIHWNKYPYSVIDKFEKENPGIKVSLEIYPVDKFMDIIDTKIATAEVPDILGTQEVTFERYIKQGVFMDLTEEDFLSNYIEEAIVELTEFSLNGRIYSIPTNAFSLGIWINKDLFENYDVTVPTNTAELATAAIELRKKGVTPFIQGIKDGWPIEQMLFPIFDVQVANKGIFNKVKTGENKWSEGLIREGFFNWSELFAKSGMLHEESMNLTYEQAFQYFEQGKVAMWPMGSWANHFLIDSHGNLKEVPFNIDYIPIYSIDSKGNKVIPGTYIGAMYSISSSTIYPEEAKKFLEFISRPENAVEFSKGNGVIFPMKNTDLLHITPYGEIVAKTTLENQLVRPFNMTIDEPVRIRMVEALQNILVGESVDGELREIQKVQEMVNQSRR